LVWNAILATMSRSSPEPATELTDEAIGMTVAATLSMHTNTTEAIMDPFLLTQDLLPSVALDSAMDLFEEVQLGLPVSLGDGRNSTVVSLAS
jgi:hypothetical protein